MTLASTESSNGYLSSFEILDCASLFLR